jgi:hypothetical protein
MGHELGRSHDFLRRLSVLRQSVLVGRLLSRLPSGLSSAILSAAAATLSRPPAVSRLSRHSSALSRDPSTIPRQSGVSQANTIANPASDSRSARQTVSWPAWETKSRRTFDPAISKSGRAVNASDSWTAINTSRANSNAASNSCGAASTAKRQRYARLSANSRCESRRQACACCETKCVFRIWRRPAAKRTRQSKRKLRAETVCRAASIAEQRNFTAKSAAQR